mgnify:CR=1 FL=1
MINLFLLKIILEVSIVDEIISADFKRILQ